MALDDISEDSIIRSIDGRVFLVFDTPEAKEHFERILVNMARIRDRNEQEGYRCGHCAAYPCFRLREETDSAGLCFQATRQCRQECNQYNHEKSPALGGPAPSGICKIDKKQVKYGQSCHISEQRGKSQL